MTVIKAIVIFCFATLQAFPVNASPSQSLLDELEISKTLSDAKPIIAALWDTWIQAHDNDIEKSLMERGISAMNTGRLEEAETVFSELIDRNASFTEAWNKRATVRFMLLKFEASRDDVFEVLKREPRHFGAISGLGLIYLRLGALEDALATYKSLQRVFPASPEPRRYIPLIRKELGLNDL